MIRIKFENGYKISTHDNEAFHIDIPDFRIVINQLGVVAFYTGKIPISVKKAILTLYKDNPHKYSHYNGYPELLRNYLKTFDEEILKLSKNLDQALRSIETSIRMPILQIEEAPPNGFPKWRIVHWRLNDDDKKLLNKFIKTNNLTKEHEILNTNTRTLTLALPDTNRSRHSIILKTHKDEIEKQLLTDNSNPYLNIFGYAIDQYEARNFEAAIVLLVNALETGLKSYIITNDKVGVAKYLIKDLKSPPLSQLLSCAIQFFGFKCKNEYKGWLGQLNEKRNKIVHKSKNEKFNQLEVARWFAIGEYILNHINGNKTFDKAGFLIDVESKTWGNTRAIILRKENDLESRHPNKIHLIVENGLSARTSSKGIKLSENQNL